MDKDFWYKQAVKPLFPDIAWSRPENKQQAGKLLIVGGNLHEFNAPAEAYSQAVEAGIGTAKVLLPDTIKKKLASLPTTTLEISYTSSTPSGSFGIKALADFLDYSLWADGVLLAGNLGHNSETAILLEKFVTKYPGILMLTQDAVDYFLEAPNSIAKREDTCLTLTIAQLQK